MGLLLRSPVLAALSITRACNLRCVHCYAEGGEPQENELSTAEMQDVLRQLLEMEVLNVDFLGGEPFMRDDFPELFKMVSANGTLVNVTTNGTMITEEWLDTVDQRISLLRIAIDSADPDTHDRFRGCPGAWRKTTQAVRAAVQRGINVTIVTTFHRRNVDELETLVELALDLGVRGYANTLLLPSGRGSALNDDVFAPEEARDFCRRWGEMRRRLAREGRPLTLIDETPLTILLAEEPGYESAHLTLTTHPQPGDRVLGRACTAGFFQLHMTPSGHLIPCGGMEGLPELCTDENDVRRRPVKDIWETAWIFRVMRDRLAVDRPHSVQGKCARCRFLPFCGGGCRAAAYLKHGDFSQADPFCWYEPEEAAV